MSLEQKKRKPKEIMLKALLLINQTIDQKMTLPLANKEIQRINDIVYNSLVEVDESGND